ncbi:DNA-binding protein, partial [Betaproteobacteria bacterium PRO4]|nr:DNA-binding protein [Betaproteobacteria bacterium PRO4]
CMTHDLWAKLNEIIFDYLGHVTLKRLVEEQSQRELLRELQREQAVVKLYDMREAAF